MLVHEGRLEDTALPNGSFSLVTAWDVLEHIPDPRPFVAHLVRLAAPGGLVVVTTLNRRALVARIFGARWSMITEDHFTYWDTRCLRRAFETSDAPETCLVDSSSYGLGRDFVSWIDRRRAAAPQANVGAAELDRVAPRGAGWDASPVVVAAEHVLNRALDVTALGVELEITLRRR